MQRHQPENLIVTNRGGSDASDSGGDGIDNSDHANDGSAGGGGDRKGAGGGGSGGAGGGGGKATFTREEVISNLVELFKEVDINGDGMMEWDEFTRFVVVKAQLHHAQMSIDQLAEYRQGSRQVEVVSYNRSCETVEQLCYIPGSYQLAVIQEHNPIVNLYNSHSWARVAQLKHNAGVHSLSYSSQYRCLISAGFDHEAHVWSPFVNSLLNRLKGHHASLVGCQAVEGTPELITADSSGVVKLWDIRTFHCVQTFQANHDGDMPRDKSSTSCFVHFKMPPFRSNQEQDEHRLVLARGKRLLPFDQYRCKTEAITDDFAVTCACFNHTSLTILTATEKTVKIWDAVGGILKGVFKGITEADITAVCLDDRQVGVVTSEVAVYNFRNGAKMKDLDTQAGPIAGLVYCGREKAVLVACQDGDMVCFDEMDPDKAVVLVNFEGGGSAYSEDLNNVAYSHCNGLVATSSCNPEDGILIWGFSTGRQEHVLAHGKAEGLASSMTSLVFLDPHPLLLVTYSDGTMRVWGVKGGPLKGLLVLTFSNQAPQEACFWGGEDAEYPLLRLKPPAKESPPKDEKPKGTVDNQEEQGPTGGTSENPTASSEEYVRNARKGGRAAADVDREETKKGTEDEQEFSEWRVHPRTTPRKDMALQVISTTWDSTSACLFTGDETGRLRCWSLRRFLEALGAEPSRESSDEEGHINSMSAESEEGRGVRHGEGEGGHGAGSTLRTQDFGGTRASMSSRRKSSINLTMLPLPATAVSADTIDFLWGAESAHEDSIGLVVFVSTDPPALLTSGADRCVKAWRLDGGPQGLLLQGLAPHAPNPRWSFSVNVEALAQAENAEAKTVLSAMRHRRVEKRLAAKEAGNAATFPDPMPQRHHRHHHNRRKRSSAGGVSLPPAQPSPLKQAQLLRQRKENTAAMALAAVGKGYSADVEGSGGEETSSASRGEARHLALQATSEGVGNYTRNDSFSDWTSSTSSASYTRYTGPSVVPPSPGRRRGRPSAGLSAVVDRLGKLLDQAESFSAEHTNRFGGRRSNLSDFARGAMLADPRRIISSDSTSTCVHLTDHKKIPLQVARHK
eukprot:g14788.t1